MKLRDRRQKKREAELARRGVAVKTCRHCGRQRRCTPEQQAQHENACRQRRQ